MRVAPHIRLTKKERMTLHSWSKGRRIPVRQRDRAVMILLAADGMSNKEIAMKIAIKPHTVGRWRSRFAALGLAGIRKDLPRGGRPRDLRERLESEIIRRTTQETPKHATHWSTRTLAKELGTTVGEAVTLAARRLRQQLIGKQLSAPLRQDETDWLDADLG